MGGYMPGGIGRVTAENALACARREREFGSVTNCNEIFYNLDGRHVFYDRTTGFLYFVDAATDRVSDLIAKVFAGLRLAPAFEQMHLDVHGIFAGARRVALDAAVAHSVLIALRLSGIRATVR